MKEEDKIVDVSAEEVNTEEIVAEETAEEVQEETAVAIPSGSIMELEKLYTMAEMLSKSTIVPVTYQRRPENCFVALDMANRTGMSPFVIMQNLFVIQGKPSWSGQAICSMIRSSKQFKNVELNYVGTEGKDDWGAYVSATRVSNGKLVKGATVTLAISKKEGWYGKTGSKWQTMPEIMLAYRAYAWFGRVYAPELIMGLLSVEEVTDIGTEEVTKEVIKNPYENGGIK